MRATSVDQLADVSSFALASNWRGTGGMHATSVDQLAGVASLAREWLNWRPVAVVQEAENIGT